MVPFAGLVCRLLAGMALAAVPAIAAEQAFSPQGGDVSLRDFAFADGENLPVLGLHYLTLGMPVRDGAGAITNAVLLLHGTTGSAADFLRPSLAEALFGPGQPLDLARFYVIIPDGIGAGRSSKPSDGLHARFPHYGYKDQVRAQHDLLQRLGVTHLKLVLGTSMGGMQTWLWGETYPTDADALVAIASTPTAIAGRNMIWREMIIQAIREDPDWQDGEYPKDKPPRDWIRAAIPLFSLMTGNAEQLQKLAPTRAAATQLVDRLEASAAALDPNDYLYTFESSADYDPAPALGKITAPFLAINFADDLLNPPAMLDLPELPNLRAAMLPGGGASYGHQTLAHADIWARPLQDFLDGVPGWR